MKRFFWLLLFVHVSVFSLSGQPYAEKIILPGSGLDNLYRIDDGVYRSEQPSAEGFRALEKFGIREVINMRADNNDKDEAAGTRLVLHRVRIRTHDIDIAEVTEVLRTIKNRKGPILIHCWHGSDRTGAVVAMYRMVFQNVPKQEAIDELVNGGFGFHAIYGNIPRMLREADIDAVRKELGLEPR